MSARVDRLLAPGAAARLRWRTRLVKPALRRPVVRWRHRFLTDGDVVLAEFPKSGSTWLAFMLGQLLSGREVGFDDQHELIPGVWEGAGAPALLPGGGRLLRSHEPHRAEYRRGVYVVRHVADVASSYRRWLLWQSVPVPEPKPFLRSFLSGRVGAYGAWQDHVASWRRAARRQPILTLRYEDLRAGPERRVAEALSFLGAEPRRDALAAAVAANTLERMRAKEDRARRGPFGDHAEGARFVGAGRVGGSVEEFDDDDFALIAEHAGEALRALGYGVRPGCATSDR